MKEDFTFNLKLTRKSLDPSKNLVLELWTAIFPKLFKSDKRFIELSKEEHQSFQFNFYLLGWRPASTGRLRAKRKLLNSIFRRYYKAFGVFSRNIDMMSPKSRKWEQKFKKNWVQIFHFSSFRLWPFYPTGINIGSKRPQLLLKHAEKQSETRLVQSFGAKSGYSAAKPHASGGRRAKNFARKRPVLAGLQPSS